MVTVTHLTMDELEAGLDYIRQSPIDEGWLELVVRRPQIDARELLEGGIEKVDLATARQSPLFAV